MYLKKKQNKWCMFRLNWNILTINEIKKMTNWKNKKKKNVWPLSNVWYNFIRLRPKIQRKIDLYKFN